MIDQVINDLIDEVALEGDQGCTFDQLFTIAENMTIKSVEKAELNAPIRFDDSYKAYFWTLIKNNEQLIFTENGAVLDTSNLIYNDMKAKENQLLVKSTEDLQDRNFYGSLKAAKESVTDNHKLILSLVAKSRYQGISQFRLGELLNMDSKSVFYYIKKLDQLGLIVRESAYADNMHNTKIIFLKRFAPQNQQNDDGDDTGELYRVETFKDDLIKQLTGAENNMMSLADSIKAMGFTTHRQVRWARVKISQLHDQELVEKFIACDGKRQKPSVRLINPYDACKTGPHQAEKEADTIAKKQIDAFYRDLPADYQFFQDIVASGENGLTRQDLVDKYPELDPSTFKLFLDCAASQPQSQECSTYMIYRTEELAGKVRLFRYFALDGWRGYNEKLGKEIVEPNLNIKARAPALEEPKSINYIEMAFGCRPSSKVTAKRARTKKPAWDSQEENAAAKPPKKKAKKLEKTITTINKITIESEGPFSQIVNRRVTRAQQQQNGNSNHTQSISTITATPATPNKRKLDEDTNDTSNRQQSVKNKENALIELQLTLPPKPKRNRKTTTELNSTKMRRCAILLDMMEKQHVRELNEITLHEFNAIELATVGGQKMASATLTKLAKQLHEEKKLKVYISTIEKPLGLTEIKKFLLHANLNEDSDEVKQFIHNYKFETPMMSGRIKRKEYRKLDVDKLPSVEDSTVEEASVQLFSGDDRNNKIFEEEAKTYAVKYGWIKSKWLRARKLHEILFQQYLSSNTSDCIVDMTIFLKHLSLDTLVMICFSLPYSDSDLRDYLDEEPNRFMSLNDLPQNIQSIVFHAKLRIRYVINFLLRILQGLGVVEALHDMESKNRYSIAPKYRMSEDGIVRDYAFKDRSIVNTIQFKSVEDVQRFWEELHSTCIHPLRHRSKQDEIDLVEYINKDDPLYGIHNRRTWVVEVMIPQKQKELLDSFLDSASNAIPSDNPALRDHLIRETGLSSKRIRAYYTGVRGAMVKKESKEEKQKARLQKQLAMSADPTINDLMLASVEKRKVDAALAKMKEEEPFVQRTYVGSRRFRRLRVRTEPDQGQDQTGHGYSLIRLNFDPLEKDMLLFSYCIMKARAKGKNFYWAPITKILTGRKAEECRRGLNAMHKYERGILVKIEQLKDKWEKYYKEGVERQEIQDENPWDTLDFDLVSYLEYFIIRMKEEEEKANAQPTCLLPRKYEDLHKYCLIVRDEKRIMRLKQSLANQGTSINTFNEDTYDAPFILTENEREGRSIEAVKILIKMLLMTFDCLYRSETAYHVMKKYPEHVVEKALEDLRAEGLVIKDKSRYGRMPGRAFNVSEKFLTIAGGILPFGLIDNARSHYATIAESEMVESKNLAWNSGIAASMLDLLSQGKISLYMKSRDKYLAIKGSIYYPKASAVSLRKAFIYQDLDVCIKKNKQLAFVNNSNVSPRHDGEVILPTAEQIKKHIHKLAKSDDLIQKVYEAVKRFEGTGASIDTIVMLINSKKKLYDDRHISDTIHSLVKHEPPLVRIVGFKQLRYVAAEFSSDWLLKMSGNKALLNPLMWIDVTGKVIQSALDGCAKAVISHILNQPGISHANLRKKFEGFFSEYELHNLLRYLVDTKTVISRKVQRDPRPTRVSIFNKRLLKSPSNNNGLSGSNEITYYWLSSDYYLFKQN